MKTLDRLVLAAAATLLPAAASAQVNTMSFLKGATSWENKANVAEHSAAAALSATTIAVADNESNVLRMYQIADGAGNPMPSPVPAALWLDAGPQLSMNDLKNGARREGDFEACTRLHGTDLIVWAGSHARTSDNDWRPNRHRIFGTRFAGSALTVFSPAFFGNPVGGNPAPIGSVYPNPPPASTFLSTMITWDRNNGNALHLEDAGRHNKVNIEGLVDKVAYGNSPDGMVLAGAYFGLRAPLSVNHEVPGEFGPIAVTYANLAIALEVSNIASVVQTPGTVPEIVRAILFDFGGRGIRSMERTGTDYLIAVGAVEDEAETAYQVFRWNGLARPITAGDKYWIAESTNFYPLDLSATLPTPVGGYDEPYIAEALCIFPFGSPLWNPGSLLAIADDGTKVGGGRMFRPGLNQHMELRDPRYETPYGRAAFDIYSNFGSAFSMASIWEANYGAAFTYAPAFSTQAPATGKTCYETYPPVANGTRVWRAQKNFIRSLNGVGFCRQVNPAGKKVLVCNQFDDGAGNQVQNLITPTPGSVVTVDATVTQTSPVTFNGTGWSNPSFSIRPGSSVWVTGDCTIFFKGRAIEITQVHVSQQGDNMEGQVHARNLGPNDLGYSFQNGDAVKLWVESSQVLNTYVFNNGAFVPSLPYTPFPAGKGFILNKAAAGQVQWETPARHLHQLTEW